MNKKPKRKMTFQNFESTSTMPNSLDDFLVQDQSTEEVSYNGKRMIKRTELQDIVKGLLVDAGLVNNVLDSKINYFYGPYHSKFGERPQKTKVEYKVLQDIMKQNRERPAGMPKKERWVAILEHICTRDFVGRLTPSMFPYLKSICEKACEHGLDGGHQTTKLPSLHNTKDRSQSLGRMCTLKSYEDEQFGEEILNVANYKIMEEVKDQTTNPLVAPIVYVLKHPQEFIHDEVYGGVDMEDNKKFMKEFNEFQKFLKEMSLGTFTKTKEEYKRQFNKDRRISMRGSSVGKKVRSKFSDPTVSSSARGLPNIYSDGQKVKVPRFSQYKRGFTTKVGSSKKLMKDNKIEKSNHVKHAKDKPLCKEYDDYSQGSVSDDDQ